MYLKGSMIINIVCTWKATKYKMCSCGEVAKLSQFRNPELICNNRWMNGGWWVLMISHRLAKLISLVMLQPHFALGRQHDYWLYRRSLILPTTWNRFLEWMNEWFYLFLFHQKDRKTLDYHVCYMPPKVSPCYFCMRFLCKACKLVYQNLASCFHP